MATSVTKICNMALGKLGSTRINDIDDSTEDSPQIILCRLHYEQTRDALIRSHFWRFASGRATLSQDTTDPDFEWDNQFILPTDFLRLKSLFSDNGTTTENTRFSYAIEGDRLLTDEGSVDLRYIKKITDTSKFDPLFVEVLILQLALKFVGPLGGGDPKLQQIVQTELGVVMRKVRALDRQETNTVGRNNLQPWVDRAASFRQDRV